jgi:hypothetical protein
MIVAVRVPAIIGQLSYLVTVVEDALVFVIQISIV